MNFSEYSKSNKKNEKISPEMKQKLAGFLSQYDGKSEDELLDSIIKVAEQNRAEGKLNNEEIDNFARMISPMLKPPQREKLKAVIEKLKNS